MRLDPAMLVDFRPRMMSVAYRMLGSVVDAEDAVQDAFVRLQSAEEVTSTEGFLVRTTTRLCIDRLRAERRRKQYIGPWVPEPVNAKYDSPDTALAQSLTQAFLLMLERLSPEERAAFLLRNVFDYEYAEIAEVLGKSESNVRQIVSRAKHRLDSDEHRFRPDPRAAEELAERFISACRAGDVKQVEEMITVDAEVHSDGGGKVSAARVVIRGRDRVAKFLTGVFHKKRGDCEMLVTSVNGEPGVVFTAGGVVIHVVSLRIENGVRAVYMTNNPDKLSRWSTAVVQ
jgi:RNA polymerase sigma-70 factor (ECF subfamily)